MGYSENTGLCRLYHDSITQTLNHTGRLLYHTNSVSLMEIIRSKILIR